MEPRGIVSSGVSSRHGEICRVGRPLTPRHTLQLWKIHHMGVLVRVEGQLKKAR